MLQIIYIILGLGLLFTLARLPSLSFVTMSHILETSPNKSSNSQTDHHQIPQRLGIKTKMIENQQEELAKKNRLSKIPMSREQAQRRSLYPH